MKYFKFISTHLLSVELDSSLWEVESLLDEAGELSDSPSLLSQHILGPGGHDDDLGPGGGHTHLRQWDGDHGWSNDSMSALTSTPE